MQIYDQLLQFQLFQGMSRSELLQLAGQTRFEFLRFKAGQTVVSEGQTCSGILFLTSGTVEMQTQSIDRGYSVNEQINSPWMMQPEALFGMSLRYSHTVTSLSATNFIVLSKDEILRLLDDFLIIRLNLLNILSTAVQRQQQRPWRRHPQTAEEQTIRFFLEHVVYPAGHKEFSILMTRLAHEIGQTRLTVSRVLNALESRGMLTLSRGRIVIPSLEQLLMEGNSHQV